MLPDVMPRLCLGVVVCACLAAFPAAHVSGPADARQERVRASVARVFDTGVLHRIAITIAPDDAQRIVR